MKSKSWYFWYNLRARFNQFFARKQYWNYLTIAFDRFGIEFPYKGDLVCWIYPWRKHLMNGRFVSILSEGSFKSLKEIDGFWDSYNKTMAETGMKGEGPDFFCKTA